jgi:hypothetical protein
MPYPSCGGRPDSAFARHYLRITYWFILLALLRYFTSDGAVQTWVWSFRSWGTGGYPHKRTAVIAVRRPLGTGIQASATQP